VPNVLRFVKDAAPLRRIDPTRGVVIAAAGSASPTEKPIDVARIRIGRLLGGIGKEITVSDAASERIPPVPEPSHAPTLQELVSRGRKLLLAERQRARQKELEAVQKAASGLAAALDKQG
jgi:hypothetical protein